VAQLGIVTAVARAGWLDGSLRVDDVALARIAAPSLGGRLASLRVETPDGPSEPSRPPAALAKSSYSRKLVPSGCRPPIESPAPELQLATQRSGTRPPSARMQISVTSVALGI